VWTIQSTTAPPAPAANEKTAQSASHPNGTERMLTPTATAVNTHAAEASTAGAVNRRSGPRAPEALDDDRPDRTILKTN
jgi:hypothetical protein